MKGALQSIFGLPIAVIGGVLNAESDWIRYGLPAVLLTVMFFFAMRFETPPAPAHTLSANRSGAATAIGDDDRSKLSPPMPASDSVQQPGPLVQPRDLGQRQRSLPPPVTAAANVPKSAPGTEAASGNSAEARRALCVAVGLALKTFPNRRKARSLRFAISGYRGGKADFQVAGRAVNGAVADYTAGKWSEDQCPPDAGGSRLPKGAIGEAMRE